MLILYGLSLRLVWFGFDVSVAGVLGWTILSHDPLGLIGIILMIVGMLSQRHSVILTGSALMVIFEVIEFVMFPINAGNSSLNLMTSFHVTHAGAYISLIIAIGISALSVLRMRR